MSFRTFIAILSTLLLFSCGKTFQTARVTFTLSESNLKSLQATEFHRSASSFQCFYLNVVGTGIEGATSASATEAEVAAGNHCTYPGNFSAQAASSTTVSLSVAAKPGRNRLVQVLGVTLASGTTCPTLDLKTLLTTAQEGSQPSVSAIYEVARTTVEDLSSPKNITLSLDLNYAQKNLVTCTIKPDLRFDASSFNSLGGTTTLSTSDVWTNGGLLTGVSGLNPSPAPTPSFQYNPLDTAFNRASLTVANQPASNFKNLSALNLGSSPSTHFFYALKTSDLDMSTNPTWTLLSITGSSSNSMVIRLEPNAGWAFQTAFYLNLGSGYTLTKLQGNSSGVTTNGVYLFHVALEGPDNTLRIQNLLEADANATVTPTTFTSFDFSNVPIGQFVLGLQKASVAEVLIYNRNLVSFQKRNIAQIPRQRYNF